MARSKGRSKRKKVDWVTNPLGYNPFLDQFALAALDGVIAIPLTISDKARILQTGVPNQPEDWRAMTWTAVPEGNRGSVHAVRGQIQWTLQADWSSGDQYSQAWRLCVHEQDPQSLAAITPLDYQLGLNTLTAGLAYNEANERFMWERKEYKRFNQLTLLPGGIFNVNWSGMRTLRPDQAVFLVTELGDQSPTVFFSVWLRALMTVGD